MRTQRLALLLIALGFLLPAGAHAQCDANNEFMSVVRSQAVLAGVVFASSGYELVDVYCGALDARGEQAYTSSIGASRRVAYVAVCDQDCSDIDLLMYEDDELVAQDVSSDDVPILRYQARQGGDDYRIVARMYACSAEPCYYAVAMYRK